jgi:hypothetical protein
LKRQRNRRPTLVIAGEHDFRARLPDAGRVRSSKHGG